MLTVPYREETPSGWSGTVEATWRVEEVAGGLRLHGDCPTCSHPSESRVLSVALVPGARPESDRKALNAGRPEPVLVVCDCSEDHDGRPADRRGCGRAGYLELVTDQP